MRLEWIPPNFTMISRPSFLTDASGVRFPLGDQPNALAVVGAELIVRRVSPHQRNDAITGRLVLAPAALEFRVSRIASLIQRLAIALAARFALGTVITHGRHRVPGALLHEDFALVPYVPVSAFAVVPRVARLEVEIVMLLPERCDAGGARGSVFAEEGGNLRTGGDRAEFQRRDLAFTITFEDCGAYYKDERYVREFSGE